MAASKALKALDTEARASTGDDVPEFVTVPLRGQDVRVKALLDWELDAGAAFQTGDLSTWAKTSLFGDDYAAVWVPARPTYRDASAFLTAWNDATGLTPGD